MSSDPRFARLKTDPRFRKPKIRQKKVVVDDRFKSLLNDDGGLERKSRRKIDKYGRKVDKSQGKGDLKQYYDFESAAAHESATPDYARGEGLLESSDEEDPLELQSKAPVEGGSSDEDDDDEAPRAVTLGRAPSSSKLMNRSKYQDEWPEIDLDEANFEDLDRQAALYAQRQDEEEAQTSTSASGSGKQTSRLAVVNLDWDHVSASHLYKIFDSLISSNSSSRGRLISVCVYPSQFGKERMAREEIEGPPAELFRPDGAILDEEMDEGDVNEETIFQQGDDSKVNNDALRKYQLERLRYYYAIATFDSPSTAAIVYSELDGTELERSANLFDLSYVPESMEFDDDARDKASSDEGVSTGLDFVTDALRHSKVKLTWDDDDNARSQVTRRTLTKKEIDENDYKNLIASSGSSSEGESSAEETNATAAPPPTSDPTVAPTPAPNSFSTKESREARRNRLRTLLLDESNLDDLPEGWGASRHVPSSAKSREAGMSVTFAPGLSAKNHAAEEEKDEENETTLDRYRRRQKEKKLTKLAKKEAKLGKVKKSASSNEGDDGVPEAAQDDFFTSDDSDTTETTRPTLPLPKSKGAKSKPPHKASNVSSTVRPNISTAEELQLLVAPSSDGSAPPKHFDMKEVLRAEKLAQSKGKRKKRHGKIDDDVEAEDGSGFIMNTNDDRFTALHEEPEFAIDPSHPQFKSTKAMKALIQERSRRQKEKRQSKPHGPLSDGLPSVSGGSGRGQSTSNESGDAVNLNSLVESVKRKSKDAESGQGEGKRRKL